MNFLKNITNCEIEGIDFWHVEECWYILMNFSMKGVSRDNGKGKGGCPSLWIRFGLPSTIIWFDKKGVSLPWIVYFSRVAERNQVSAKFIN